MSKLKNHAQKHTNCSRDVLNDPGISLMPGLLMRISFFFLFKYYFSLSDVAKGYILYDCLTAVCCSCSCMHVLVAGEECALHFNIPPLTADMCKNAQCAIISLSFWLSSWRQRHHPVLNPWSVETQLLKTQTLSALKLTQAHPALKDIIENQCSHRQWKAVRIDWINQGSTLMQIHVLVQSQTNPHQKAVWLHRKLASCEYAERG